MLTNETEEVFTLTSRDPATIQEKPVIKGKKEEEPVIKKPEKKRELWFVDFEK